MARISEIGSFWRREPRGLSADAVARAFRAISDEATLDGLKERLLSAAVELAGAERGLLILRVDGELTVTAEARGTAVSLVDPACPLDDAVRASLTAPRTPGGPECRVPLSVRERSLGFLVLFRPGGFSAKSVATLELLAAHGSAVLERAQRQAALERQNQELHRSEELYRRATAQAGAVPYVLDYESGSYTFMGDQIEELIGYSPDELTPDLFGSLVLETHLLGEQAGLDDAEASHRTRAGEFPRWRADIRVRTRDGRIGWLADASVEIPGDDGRSVGSIGVLQDITDRMRTEEERTRLAAILEATTDVVGMFDPEGRALYLNRAGRRLLAISEQDEVSSLSIADLHPKWVAERVLGHGMATASAEGVWTGESALLSRHGREIPVSQVLLAHKEVGKVRFFSTIARDMTERKELEAQLRQAQKMEAVGRLAGGIAHDFNNLLTAIGGYSMLLLDRLGSEDPARGEVEEIVKAGDLAAALTKQLLVFSRRQVLEPRVLDLNAVVTEVESLLRRLIREDVVLETRLGLGPLPVSADQGQLSQVIVNLVVNGEDAMPAGGRLTIETAALDLDEHDVRGRVVDTAGAYATLSVIDTGLGMDEETRAQIFEPFFTTKTRGKGTGLGLATLYGIVEQSGGHVDVRSEPGIGTTFTIYLPRVEEVPVVESAPDEELEPPVGHESVLLVEDEEAVRALARDVLRLRGYTVVEAADGEEALRVADASEGPVDLLVTDLVMPGMNGRELAERLLARWPGLRVLFMSGYTDDAIFRSGSVRVGEAFLQKPFTPSTLVQKVREALELPPALASR